MGWGYSTDLRERVIADVTEGLSRRAAGNKLRVSASSAVRWVKRYELTGSVAPQPRRGVSRSPLDSLKDWLLDLIAAEPDLTLEAVVKRVLEERGVKTSTSAVDRFYTRHKVTFKKSLHASEQSRPDVAEARRNWKIDQPNFDPSKLVFIDETGANTKMVRLYGRSRKGTRLVSHAPGGHWKTTTFTAGLRCNGLIAPLHPRRADDGRCFPRLSR